MPTSPDDLTRVSDETVLAPSGQSGAGGATSSGFAPGVIVAGRYRLVTLLGRGGMGEVYRADDLTLNQPVALKFLPADVARDGARLAQFHNELRLARQVSHRNVCRLHDVGEADGRPFLTMEYIDGEDLSSLLRRIGRLPTDKALEVARQLAAGLAAAHERGVLHRDLKPANVMIDGAGNARITDFGLAAVAGDENARLAGTPQYMAPEQLAGEPATIASDLYALGLVLYELFTGKRVFEAKSIDDLRKLQTSGSTPAPASIVRDLDPAVERVIMRCLEREPSARPPSALAVMLALSGGNALAAALAAGETPSPEMIAAAGRTDALRPAIGLALVAVTAIGFLAFAVWSDHALLAARIPLNRSREVLADRAGETLRSLGYVEAPGDATGGFTSANQYLNWVVRTDPSPARWKNLSSASFPTISFWYRTSPSRLEPEGRSVTLSDPPFTTPGMITSAFDTTGRLRSLTARPLARDGAVTRVAMDWSKLFDAAGLSIARFHPVPVTRTPPVFADERMAWEGPLYDHEDVDVHVEAAAHEGRPVFFSMDGPWTSPSPAPALLSALGPLGPKVGTYFFMTIFITGLVLVRRQLVSGQSDRRSANRGFMMIVLVLFAAWALQRRHVPDLYAEWGHLFDLTLPSVLLGGTLFWVLYVALEPFARRHWPEMLFSWTRLMSGELRDPRVGRDVLVSVASVGVIGLWMIAVDLVVPHLFGGPPPRPRDINVEFLFGESRTVAWVLRYVPNALQSALLFAFVVSVGRAITRTVWPAIIGGVMLFAVLFLTGADLDLTSALDCAFISAVFMTVLQRFGVIALVTTWFSFYLLSRAPLTLDFSKLYGMTSLTVMIVIAGLAAYGYYASQGGAGQRAKGKGQR